MYDTGLYAPHLIFNMDEVAFELSSSRRVRRVAPRTHPKNGQAVPPSNEHITSVACIGIDSAPVPPLIIYQGAQLQENWFKVGEKGDGAVRPLSINTDSGWINSYVMLKWLEDAFDPILTIWLVEVVNDDYSSSMVPNRTPKWISLKHVGLGTLS